MMKISETYNELHLLLKSYIAEIVGHLKQFDGEGRLQELIENDENRIILEEITENITNTEDFLEAQAKILNLLSFLSGVLLSESIVIGESVKRWQQ